MARNRFTQTTLTEFALVAATQKTLLQLNAAAGVRVAITGGWVSFDSTSNVAEPAEVVLIIVSAAGTGTARNPIQLDADIATALQLTGTENHTVEAANSDIVATWHIHPQAGSPIPLMLPEGEFIMAGGTRVALKCTAPANVNGVATLIGEE